MKVEMVVCRWGQKEEKRRRRRRRRRRRGTGTREVGIADGDGDGRVNVLALALGHGECGQRPKAVLYFAQSEQESETRRGVTGREVEGPQGKKREEERTPRWKADGEGTEREKTRWRACSPVPRREYARACTTYTRCSERKACPFARARTFARDLLVSSQDLRLPRLFYFPCLSVNLLSLHALHSGCSAKHRHGTIRKTKKQLTFSYCFLRIQFANSNNSRSLFTWSLYSWLVRDQNSRHCDLFYLSLTIQLIIFADITNRGFSNIEIERIFLLYSLISALRPVWRYSTDYCNCFVWRSLDRD